MKYVILLFVLSILPKGNKKILLYHENSKAFWIECFVNEDGYLENKACVFSEKGKVVFEGYFENGYSRDSTIMYFTNNRMVKYYFEDSINYEAQIFHNDKMIEKTFIINNKGGTSITYYPNGLSDTFAITGGGRPSSSIRSTLSYLKRINYEIDN